ACRRSEEPHALATIASEPVDRARGDRAEASATLLDALHRDDASIEIDVVVIELQRLVNPQPRGGDQPEQGRARPSSQLISRAEARGARDDLDDRLVRIDVWPCPARLAGDQPGWGHLGPSVVRLEPAGKD